MSDSNPEKTYLYVVDQLEKMKLRILHFMESPRMPNGIKLLEPEVKKKFSGTLVLSFEI